MKTSGTGRRRGRTSPEALRRGIAIVATSDCGASSLQTRSISLSGSAPSLHSSASPTAGCPGMRQRRPTPAMPQTPLVPRARHWRTPGNVPREDVGGQQALCDERRRGNKRCAAGRWRG
eukprot:365552-Chlamydomonas_euryale.AAC.1